MATFDTLIDDLASRFGLGANARALVREVLTMISSSPGGLGGFLDKFKSAGLTSEVASWLGRPDAAPMAAGKIERALGATALSGIAGRFGLGAGRRVDRARIRLAEDHRPFDAGRRRSRRGAPGGHGFSLATTSRGGDGASRAEADRRPSGERARRASRPSQRWLWPALAALAVVGHPFLFLVDPQPDAVLLRLSPRRRSRRRPRPRPSPRRRPPPRSCAAGRATPRRRLSRRRRPPPLLLDGSTGDRSARLRRRLQTPAPAPQRPSPAPSTEAQATAPQASPQPAAQRPPRLRLRRPDRRLQPRLRRRSQRLSQPRPPPPPRRPNSRSATTMGSCARQAPCTTTTQRPRSSTRSTRSSARTK